MIIDKDDFEQIQEKGRIFYESISSAQCSYLNRRVYFNSQGLEHLYYKQRSKRRSDQDKYMRFKLIHLAPEILKLSRTLQGLLEVNRFEKVRVHNRTELVMQNVKYFEFIALIQRNRIKVIVKQVGNGDPFFWSIIPFWGMNKKTMSRIFHEGSPEED